MFCKACGSDNPEGTEFCGGCGAAMGTSASVPPATTPPAAVPAPRPTVPPPAAAPAPPPAAVRPAAPPPMPTQYPAPGYSPGGGYYPPQQPPRKSRALMWSLIAALIIVVGAGGGVAAYLLTRDDDGKTLTSTGQTKPTQTSLTGTSATATSNTTSVTVTVTATTPTTAGPPSGGTLAVYITEPDSIDPMNLWESQGIQVGNAVFDSLASFDYATGNLLPAAAESWDANADATVWTFHLVPGATFHDGSPVTAADFKYAWERICDPDNGSSIAYHLAAVQGYDAMQDGSGTDLYGVIPVNDLTLEVRLSYSFGDFEFVVGHPALAPVPREAVEADSAGFAEQPIGNGPFELAEPWRHDQEIKVVRYDGYYGTKAYLDGVDFKIFTDAKAGWLEFEAGNLDFAEVPAADLEQAARRYGESADGITVAPGKQVLRGPESAIYYVLLNTQDDLIGNVEFRQALSLAIDRQAIADIVYGGTRDPATSIVPPGVAGYERGAWQYCRYDVEAAKAKLAEYGYPDGQGLPEIIISYNQGAGHEDIMNLIKQDWEALGLTVSLEGTASQQYYDRLFSGDYMVGRSGWIADYPIIDNFVYPLFDSRSLDNYSLYVNPSVDMSIDIARQTVDTAQRIAKYQQIVRTVGDECPVIPIVSYRHQHVGSDRVNDLVYSALGFLSLETAWISE